MYTYMYVYLLLIVMPNIYKVSVTYWELLNALYGLYHLILTATL